MISLLKSLFVLYVFLIPVDCMDTYSFYISFIHITILDILILLMSGIFILALKPTWATPMEITSRNRLDVIIPLVQGKKVLDCGGIDHDNFALKHQRGLWLHDLLVQYAASVLGVDILEDKVKEMNRRGYHFICQNVETLNLPEKFDVVVAGEIIEHLSNPGLFLQSIKAVLKEDGILILTTPNVHAILRLLQVLLSGEAVHPEHTCWFSGKTLQQLLRLNGYQVRQLYWCNAEAHHWSIELFRKLVSRVRKDLGQTLLIIASPLAGSDAANG